jgi:hypothetical protein
MEGKGFVMKRVTAAVCVALAAMALGCKGGGQAGAPAPAPSGWTRVYAIDFKDVQKAPAEWLAVSGEVRVAGGALELKGESGSDGQIVLKAPKCPGSVRLEAVACLTGDEVCDLSPFLNGGESGFDAGYLLQFGGGGNQENRVRRAGEIVDSVADAKTLVKAGQKYRIVAENDGGKVRLLVDGKELLSFKDAAPLKGPENGNVGFYTWGCTLKIEKVEVYSK